MRPWVDLEGRRELSDDGVVPCPQRAVRVAIRTYPEGMVAMVKAHCPRPQPKLHCSEGDRRVTTAMAAVMRLQTVEVPMVSLGEPFEEGRGESLILAPERTYLLRTNNPDIRDECRRTM